MKILVTGFEPFNGQTVNPEKFLVQNESILNED